MEDRTDGKVGMWVPGESVGMNTLRKRGCFYSQPSELHVERMPSVCGVSECKNSNLAR